VNDAKADNDNADADETIEAKAHETNKADKANETNEANEADVANEANKVGEAKANKADEDEAEAAKANKVDGANEANKAIVADEALARTLVKGEFCMDGPESGVTPAAPQLKQDLEAILHLTEGDLPSMRCARSKLAMTADSGFGNTSSGGFGATMERPRWLHGRFSLWAKGTEEQSSNYQELCKLVKTVEEEAKKEHLKSRERWLFMDNLTAESCFSVEAHPQSCCTSWSCVFSGRPN
jgi:hypothetical protein